MYIGTKDTIKTSTPILYKRTKIYYMSWCVSFLSLNDVFALQIRQNPNI